MSDNWLAKLKPADQKVVKAREMRLAGAHYHEIAEKLGVTPDQAWALVKDGVKVNQGAGVAVERWVQAGRLDEALKVALDIVIDKDKLYEADVRLKAIAQVINIEARRAKLLGLDAPELKIIQALDDGEENKREKATPQRAAQLMREAFGLVGPTANEATSPEVDKTH
jgi:hypothetical protein